jgi:hypothetical protein
MRTLEFVTTSMVRSAGGLETPDIQLASEVSQSHRGMSP